MLFWGKQLINWKERWQVSTYWMENSPCPPGGRRNINLCHLGEKYERLKRKRRKMYEEKGRKGERKRENRK
jgi:hypothetical protein